MASRVIPDFPMRNPEESGAATLSPVLLKMDPTPVAALPQVAPNMWQMVLKACFC